MQYISNIGEKIPSIEDNKAEDIHKILQQVEEYMRRRDWEEADRQWEKIRHDFPKNTAGYLRGTAALLEMSRFDDADILAQTAVASFPNDAACHNTWAEVAMRRRDWEQASGRWEQVRAHFPKNTAGYLRGTTALLEMSRFDDADILAQTAIKSFPNDTACLSNWAEVAMRRCDWEQANGRWEQVRARFSKNTAGYLRGTTALLEMSRFDNADTLAETAVAAFPNDAACHNNWAEVAMRRRDWEQANGRWEQVRARFPKNTAGYLRGTIALLEMSRFDDADTLAQTAVASFPNDTACHNNWAEVAMRRRDWEEANKRWEQVRKTFPQTTSGYIRGIAALRVMGKFEDTNKLALKTIEYFPYDPAGYYQRAELEMFRRDWEAAVNQWADYRKRFPHSSLAYIRSSIALSNMMQFDKAEELIVLAIKRFPSNAACYGEYAELSMRRRNWEEANKRWEQVRASFPQNTAGYIRGSSVLFELQSFKEADALSSLSMKLFPYARGCRNHYAELATRKKDWDEAARRWEMVRNDGLDSVGWRRGVDVFLAASQLSEADHLALEAMKKFPYEPGRHAQYVQVAINKQDWDEAIHRWEKMHAQFSHDVLSWNLGIEIMRNTGAWDEAKHLAQTALELFPYEIVCFNRFAELSLQRKNWDEAFNCWSLARERFPHCLDGYTRASLASSTLGKYNQAEQLSATAIRLFPYDAESYINRAELAMRRRDWNEALQRWAEIREKFPFNPTSYIRTGFVYIEQKNFMQAEFFTKQALLKFPVDVGVYNQYVDIAMRQFAWKEALSRLSEMNEKFPTTLAYYIKKASCFKELGHFDKLIDLFKEGRKKYPDSIYLSIKFAQYFLEINKKDYIHRSIVLVKRLLKNHYLYSNAELFNIISRLIYVLLGIDKIKYEKLINELLYKASLQKCDLFISLPSIISTYKGNLYKNDEYNKSNTFIKNTYLDILSKHYLNKRYYTRVYIYLYFSKKIDYKIISQETIYNLFSKLGAISFAQLFFGKSKDIHEICNVFELWILNEKNYKKVLNGYFLFILSCVSISISVEAYHLFIRNVLFKYISNFYYDDYYKYTLTAGLNSLTNNIKYSVKSYRKKLSIALCIAGQLRGYQEAFSSIDNFIDRTQYNINIFVHTWSDIGRKFPYPLNHAKRTFSGQFLIAFQKELQNIDKLKEYYPTFYDLLKNDEKILKDQLVSFYNTNNVSIDDSTLSLFQNMSNAEKMYYKNYKCYSLIKEVEKFDIVIRIRPDVYYIDKQNIDWENIAYHCRNKIFIDSRTQFHYWSKFLGCGDLIAAGSVESMDKYMNVYKDSKNFFWKENIIGYPEKFIGHQTLAAALYYYGIETKDIKIKKYKFCDPKKLTSEQIYNALYTDISKRKEIREDNILLTACYNDIENELKN